MALLGIIVLFSEPFAQSFYKKNQLQRVADEIKIAVHTAKMQALITNDRLVLSPLLGFTDWSEGMLLFVDNIKHQYSKNDKIIHEWHWNLKGVHVSWHGLQSKDYLLFATDLSCSTTNGYFMIQNTLQQQVKLILNRVARVRQAS